MFPPSTILVGIDFSEPSGIALGMAARLAVQCGARLHVLYAEDPLIGAAARAANVRPCEDARQELLVFARASALPPELTIRPHVIEGRPADVICTIGRREQAGIIVVGTHGSSAVNRLVFGSTADAVLRCSELPVLLVPPAWTPPVAASTDLTGCGPIITGVDFTIGSLEAISAASGLARLLDATLELVHVVPDGGPVDARRGRADDAVTRHTEMAHRELARIARALLATSMRVDTRVVRGPVSQALADVVQSFDGDPLLVLGRRRTSFHGDAPGAIAHRAALLSEVPTLMYMATESGD